LFTLLSFNRSSAISSQFIRPCFIFYHGCLRQHLRGRLAGFGVESTQEKIEGIEEVEGQFTPPRKIQRIFENAHATASASRKRAGRKDDGIVDGILTVGGVLHDGRYGIGRVGQRTKSGRFEDDPHDHHSRGRSSHNIGNGFYAVGHARLNNCSEYRINDDSWSCYETFSSTSEHVDIIS